MAIIMLCMAVGGIGLALWVSDPRQVTLGWLRLGGLVALGLFSVAATVLAISGGDSVARAWGGLAVLGVSIALHLLTVQLGMARAQRAAAGGVFLSAILVVVATRGLTGTVPGTEVFGDGGTAAGWLMWGRQVLAVGAGAGLLGGFLMTMLLGHAYLTAGGKMSQAPLARLVVMLIVLLALRSVMSVEGALWHYWGNWGTGGFDRSWDVVMVTSRYAVGLAVPAVFVAMVYDCVRRRSNQSATGILYVATVLVMLGEGIALALNATTGLWF